MRNAAILEATPRSQAGKGAARALRRQAQVPVVLYNKGGKPLSLSVSLKDLTLEFHKGALLSRLIELKVGKDSYKALAREVQLHPVSDVIEHADFLKVDAGEKIRVGVPVHVKNQDKSPGLKRGGVLNIVRHEVDLLCLPESIPDFIEVDVADTEIGASIHINSVKLPEGVTPSIKRNFTVVTIAGRSAQMDIVETTAAATTVEGGEAATTVEGAEDAAPAEGGDKKPDAKSEKK